MTSKTKMPEWAPEGNCEGFACRVMDGVEAGHDGIGSHVTPVLACAHTRGEAAGNEGFLLLAQLDLRAHRLFDEAGEGFAFLQDGFSRLAQGGIDAQRGERCGFHAAALVRCICNA